MATELYHCSIIINRLIKNESGSQSKSEGIASIIRRKQHNTKLLQKQMQKLNRNGLFDNNCYIFYFINTRKGHLKTYGRLHLVLLLAKLFDYIAMLKDFR